MGINGLGAINLVMLFIMVVNAVFMLTTIGGVTIMAIRLGRGDKAGAKQEKELKRYFHAGLFINFVGSPGNASGGGDGQRHGE